MRNGTSTRLRNGCSQSMGCSQSGNNGNGTTIPDSTIVIAGVTRSIPWEESVHSMEICMSMVIHVDNRIANPKDMANNMAESSERGRCRAHASKPRPGSMTMATITKGMHRKLM